MNSFLDQDVGFKYRYLDELDHSVLFFKVRWPSVREWIWTMGMDNSYHCSPPKSTSLINLYLPHTQLDSVDICARSIIQLVIMTPRIAKIRVIYHFRPFDFLWRGCWYCAHRGLWATPRETYPRNKGPYYYFTLEINWITHMYSHYYNPELSACINEMC